MATAPTAPDGDASGVPFRLRWLETGATALDAMFQAIVAARRSIRLEIYIFTADIIGNRFLEALTEAQRRGVEVRVMVDAVGSVLLSTAFWDPFIREGGQFHWFNPFQSEGRYGYRNHRKLLVVDDEEAFIGGFNVSEDYHGDGVLHGWRDLGVALTGPVVRALAATFDDLFSRARQPLPAFPPLHRRPNTEIYGKGWTLLLSGPGRGYHAMKRSLLSDLRRAKSVQIISAYFLPTLKIRRALKRVVAQGGRVELILAGKSDVRLSQMAGRSLYANFMRAGVEIYEYQPQILHTKLFVMDDVVYVGSANLDARSLKLNYELLLRIDDPQAAQKAREIFAVDLAQSEPIEPARWLASRGIWNSVSERAAYLLLAHGDPLLTGIGLKNRVAGKGRA